MATAGPLAAAPRSTSPPHPIPCSPHTNTITEPSNRHFAEMTIKGQPAPRWPSPPAGPGCQVPGRSPPTLCWLLVNVMSRQHHGQKKEALIAPPSSIASCPAGRPKPGFSHAHADGHITSVKLKARHPIPHGQTNSGDPAIEAPAPYRGPTYHAQTIPRPPSDSTRRWTSFRCATLRPSAECRHSAATQNQLNALPEAPRRTPAAPLRYAAGMPRSAHSPTPRR